MSNTDNKGIKPPLGIKPEWLWKEERLYELNSAVIRYVSENMPIPPEWIEEIKSLREWIDKRKASHSIKEEEVGWEILKGKTQFGTIHTWINEEGVLNSKPCLKVGCKIHSVRRKSDGEVFTVGDSIEFFFGVKIISGTISHFTKCDSMLDIYLQEDITCCYRLNDLPNNKGVGEKLVKAPKKQVLFTTEDGVQIFEGDRYFFIDLDWDIRYTGDGYNWVGGGLKAFSTKEAAYEYVLLNKECLSLNDIKKVFGNESLASVHNYDIQYSMLKQLIKERLKIN